MLLEDALLDLESDELEDASDLELELSLDELALSGDEDDEEDSPVLLLSFFLSLKSVSYQPVPFSWKLGADNIFLSALSPHSGQSRSGSSLSFWSASNWWPQLSQRYS